MQILKQVLGITAIFGIVLGLMLIAFEDNIPLTLFRRLKCRFGYHSTIKKFGKAKVNKYYCSICKKPRKHPGLKMIEGGNKLGSNRFDF